MNKKAFKYFILLLVVPLLVSLMLSFTNLGKPKVDKNDDIGGLYIPEYKTNSENYIIKSSDTYIYSCVFIFIIMGGIVYLFVCKKKE